MWTSAKKPWSCESTFNPLTPSGRVHFQFNPLTPSGRVHFQFNPLTPSGRVHFQFKGCLVYSYCVSNKNSCQQAVETWSDAAFCQTPCSAASDRGLHCLPMSLLWDVRQNLYGLIVVALCFSDCPTHGVSCGFSERYSGIRKWPTVGVRCYHYISSRSCLGKCTLSWW